MDAKLRAQLVAARENITTQLLQLESASLDPYSFGGSPDSRDVYAELQKELREIDDLLHIKSGSDDLEPSDATKFTYRPMATFVTTQGQWMWRFRGIAAGAMAIWAIGWFTLFIMSTRGTRLLPAGASVLVICLASVWGASRSRERESRLFLFTVAVSTALVGTAMLLIALTSTI